MRVYVCIYISSIDVYIYIFVYIYLYACLCVLIYTGIYTDIYLCTGIDVRIDVRALPHSPAPGQPQAQPRCPLHPPVPLPPPALSPPSPGGTGRLSDVRRLRSAPAHGGRGDGTEQSKAEVLINAFYTISPNRSVKLRGK